MKNSSVLDDYDDKKLPKNSNKKSYKKIKARDMDSDDEICKLEKGATDYYGFWATYLEAARNMLRFIYIDQWEDQVRSYRTIRKKPVMTFNKLVPIRNGILGDFRDNTPAIAVRAADDKTTQQQVDIINGYFRYINYKSEANVVYQELLGNLLDIGWGAFLIDIEYESENSFNKCPVIKYLYDYNSYFFDRKAKLPDKSDGDLCGYYEPVSKDDFEKAYPNIDSPESAGTYYWSRYEIDKDCLILCHQWQKKYYKKVMVRLSDGQEMEESEANDYINKINYMMISSSPPNSPLSPPNYTPNEINPFENQPIPIEITDKREILDYDLYYYKYIKNNILECKKWPGKKLPIIFSMGIYTFINGDFRPISYFKDAMDSQKFTNYVLSETAYAILSSRREQWLGTKSNIEGDDIAKMWRSPQDVLGMLLAKPDPTTGALPQKITGDSFDQSLLQAAQLTDQQISSCLGRYDESRGQESNAQSGIAISNRQTAGNLPINMIEDNVKRAIKQGADVMLELIPFVLNNQRNISVLNKIGDHQTVPINQPSGFQIEQDGNISQMINNDMTTGKYDVEVRVDDTYEQQQLSTFDTLAKLSANNPQIGMLSADLLVKYSGLPCAIELEDRLKQAAYQQANQPQQQSPEMMIQMQRIQLEQQQLAFDQQKFEVESELKKQELETERYKTMQQSSQSHHDMMLKNLNDDKKLQVETYKADTDLAKAHLNSKTKLISDHIKSNNNPPKNKVTKDE